jgi:hypothetical protein
MTEKQRVALRKKCMRDLFPFCIAIMGYDDLIDELHGDYCRFLQGAASRKQATMPRSFVKTWIGSIAYPIWTALPRKEEDEFPYAKAWEDKFWQLGPNLRTLIASYVITNAEKMLSLIKKTYEANVAMQILFPEVIPDNFRKTRWSNQALCIQRENDATEATFEAAGIGGASTSRHYDQILEDDLIYANKDDFTGKELMPNQEDIDKAIGWHKLAMSLLVPGKHTRIHNVGTRWAKHDLVDYIWTNEPDYAIFRRACVKIPDKIIAGNMPDHDLNWRELEPEWSVAYDHEQLERIARAQGPYMFATQYLLLPSSPEETLFKPSWLEYYKTDAELPSTMRIFTTIDVSEWEVNSARKKGVCNSAVLTCGWCDKHHMWILGYDYGRFNPSEVIMLMAKHWGLYKPERIGVEAVYYQKALAHFAREYMEEGKVPWMTLSQLIPENGKSKDLRIRGLEPLASNHAIHCKVEHTDFISEFIEYIPESRLCKKDLLDCCAYQIQIARPGDPLPLENKRRTPINRMVVGTADELLRSLWDREKSVDIFGNPGAMKHPFGQSEEEAEIEKILAEATDPFSESGTNDFQWEN